MPSSKIKIFFLIDELLIGGTEKQLLWLVNNLPRELFDPVIGMLKGKKTCSTSTVYFDFLSNSYCLRYINSIRKLRAYINKHNFDIVQTYFPDSEICASFAVKLCKYKPVLIGTRRNLYHWIKKEPITFTLLRFSNQIVDKKILANSYKALKACQRIENIPPEKIKVIQNAIEIDTFNRISPKEAKKFIHIENTSPVIGVVANWRPIKGLTTFLKASAIVSKKIPTAKFILMGNGPQESELKTLAQKLGIYDKVIFLNNSWHVPTVIAAFDIAVQPSLSESFSNVLLEYMASAKPIVATKVGDTELVIRDGKEGLLVQPNNPVELADKIIYFCNNQNIATKMGQAAYERVVKNWSSEKILKDYITFYEEVLKKR